MRYRLLPLLLLALAGGCFQVALEPDAFRSGLPVRAPGARLTFQDDGPPSLDGGFVPTVGLIDGLRDAGQFRTELLKPLPTGGVAGITFRDDYARAFLPNGSPVLNPANLGGVDFTFEQPLLQGAGVL